MKPQRQLPLFVAHAKDAKTVQWPYSAKSQSIQVALYEKRGPHLIMIRTTLHLSCSSWERLRNRLTRHYPQRIFVVRQH